MSTVWNDTDVTWENEILQENRFSAFVIVLDQLSNLWVIGDRSVLYSNFNAIFLNVFGIF